MKFPNAEKLVLDYLNNSELDVEAFAEVPASRPKRFITVERTGGRRLDVVREEASLAIQVWAESRFEASALADEVDEELYEIKFSSSVYRFRRLSKYNFPDSESKHYRYQITIELIISN